MIVEFWLLNEIQTLAATFLKQKSDIVIPTSSFRNQLPRRGEPMRTRGGELYPAFRRTYFARRGRMVIMRSYTVAVRAVTALLAASEQD